MQISYFLLSLSILFSGSVATAMHHSGQMTVAKQNRTSILCEVDCCGISPYISLMANAAVILGAGAVYACYKAPQAVFAIPKTCVDLIPDSLDAHPKAKKE